jgi:hypothetical protein
MHTHMAYAYTLVARIKLLWLYDLPMRVYTGSVAARCNPILRAQFAAQACPTLDFVSHDRVLLTPGPIEDALLAVCHVSTPTV